MLRGSIPRATEWGVSVDLFFFREPDEVEQSKEQTEGAAPAFTEEAAPAFTEAAPAGEDAAADGGWDESPPAPVEEPVYVDPAAAAGWDAAAPEPTDSANAGW